MRIWGGLIAVAASLVGVAALRGAATAAEGAAPAGRLPAFTHAADADWINSGPLSVAGLRGRPVLVEVRTFACSSCLASLPWMARIAVHTPERSHEHDPAALRRAVARLAIRYPVMIDEDYTYWQALGNRYWPAFHLYDGDGREIGARVGELHAGEVGADDFERRIAATLSARPARAAP
jgi:hypothetical protein